nr:methionine--tRNA ligase subunit beta [Bacteroidota bacterium]
LQICANLTVLMEAFLPFTAKKLGAMLNLDANLKWNDASRTNLLLPGHQINTASLLFDKIEDETIAAQIQKLQDSKKMNETEKSEETSQKSKEVKAEIIFDDFSKMDIRVGTILEAEKVPKADKLLKLKIDTGIDIRTVVSGIAVNYKPEDIIGQQVSILVNLAPRKIKGIDSQGMILMSENSKGELSFVSPTKVNTENGSVIK